MLDGYKLGDIVAMKKVHPCGTNEWEIIRVGADVKLQCLSCKKIVMLSRPKFIKAGKKILISKKEEE